MSTRPPALGRSVRRSREPKGKGGVEPPQSKVLRTLECERGVLIADSVKC